MSDPNLIGKWVMTQGQQYAGLWFQFNADGTYRSELPGFLKIVAAGIYEVTIPGEVNITQTQHSMGMVGTFAGLYRIEGDTLSLAFPPVPGGPRPKDLSGARTYRKES